MIIQMFRTKFFWNRITRRCSTKANLDSVCPDFKDTIFLPKSTFEAGLKNAVARDALIQKEADFANYYNWQREHMTGKEFILHDGPPYANGEPHMGHAINKILKDIILRSQLVQGKKVHFVPGWDCHGLPIELIALKGKNVKMTPLEIRNTSKELAFSKINIQKEAFKKWGVLGDWDNNCYYTCDVNYVINQLQMFWKLYEKGYLYYGLKPVYWSPSSRTALAEAELVYKHDHVSKAVTMQFEVITQSASEPMYLLIWTTTPWTLPLNEAVYFSAKIDYCLVKISSLPGNFIIAVNLIKENEMKLNKEISIVRAVSHDELLNMKYKHPWRYGDLMKVFESPVVEELATGLLHCVPSHGHDDFLLGIKDGLKMNCFIDEAGCYMTELGPELEGLSVLEEGSSLVIEKLRSSIICEESFVHSYPYDWRTDKPVIIRSSHQWFINTEKLKEKAIACLSHVSVPMEHFKDQLEKRPYWCISRQRVWGVPIPFFIRKDTKKPLLSEEVIHHLCKIFKKFGVDSWWSMETSELIPISLCENLNVNQRDIERGNDIMDIWFDSGISWSFALRDLISDVCVEGADQLQGWFQTSLWTSVALREKAPYKKILVHGFAVDKNGNKMSKSLGNVFDPRIVVEGTNALGVDTLRWWVGAHGHHSKVPISMDILKNDKRELHKLRMVLKFILGCLTEFQWPNDDRIPSSYLDTYFLNECYINYHLIMNSYNSYNFQGVISQFLYFLSEISSLYIASVKDRLYCDDRDTERRKSCIITLDGILNTMCYCVAPIIPHLVEEVYMHHPSFKGKKFFYNNNMWMPPVSWKNDSAVRHIQLAKDIRNEILRNNNSQQLSCKLEADEKDYKLLTDLQNGKEYSTDSELTELLQVASVDVKIGKRQIFVEKSNMVRCQRCRRYTATSMQLCPRCENIISRLNRERRQA